MNSNKLRQTVSLALIGAVAVNALASAPSYQVSPKPLAVAEFTYTVTLIPVGGTVKAVSAKLNLDPKNLATASGTVSVNLGKLDTGIGLRDEHARNYLGAEKHPNAIFTLQKISGATALENGKQISANAIGTFNLNGISRPLVAPIVVSQKNNRIAVQTAFDVQLSAHKISIPGGDDKVGVKVSFELEPSSKP